MTQCVNRIHRAGDRWGSACRREAAVEYAGRQLCRVCAAAKKRGDAISAAATERYAARSTTYVAVRDQNTRKLAAFDDLLHTGEAVSAYFPPAERINVVETRQMVEALRAAIAKAKEAQK